MPTVKCIRLDTGEVLIVFVKKHFNGDYTITDAQTSAMIGSSGFVSVKYGEITKGSSYLEKVIKTRNCTDYRYVRSRV